MHVWKMVALIGSDVVHSCMQVSGWYVNEFDGRVCAFELIYHCRPLVN